MDRISGANFVVNAQGKRVFADRNASTGVAGTFFNALWCTGVQESIIEAVEAAGLVPGDGDNTQLLQAIGILRRAQIFAYATPGNFTFTPPAGMYGGHVLVIGGGGPGAPGASGSAGSGGSAGGLAWGNFNCTPGTGIPGVVGQAGQPSPTVAGGTSSFAAVSATGGQPGNNSGAGSVSASNAGGQGFGGVLNISGNVGADGYENGSYYFGGNGASGPLGGFGYGALTSSSSAVVGYVGYGPGSGGGGSVGAGAVGSAGGPGLVLIFK